MLSSCPSLRSLNVEFCRLITDKGVSPISRLCNTSLLIQLKYRSPFQSRRPGCALLEELNISGCTSITEEGLCQLLANQPLLYRIVARHSSAITDSAVVAIAHNCSQARNSLAVIYALLSEVCAMLFVPCAAGRLGCELSFQAAFHWTRAALDGTSGSGQGCGLGPVTAAAESSKTHHHFIAVFSWGCVTVSPSRAMWQDITFSKFERL